MQETFPREAAANPEPFTGERLTASIHGQVEIEHYHRYLFARGFCRDRDVLDVASGEGYGAAQLAQVAAQVVGVEYSGSPARHAAEKSARPDPQSVPRQRVRPGGIPRSAASAFPLRIADPAASLRGIGADPRGTGVDRPADLRAGRRRDVLGRNHVAEGAISDRDRVGT